jgi:UDP-N-acetylmuramate--alanine ligase
LSLSIDGTHCQTLHFAGILGSGMSAVAQYCAWEGLRVTGSDRLLDSLDVKATRDRLAALGCLLFAQDGSGPARGADALVVSTAIEETNPDIAAARGRGIPIVHRSDVLAAIVRTKTTVAVAGTSGKSTVAAMIWEFLDGCGKAPSLITGAGLIRLEERGLIGNAFKGASDILVIEADESDGTCAKYQPYLSVFLNVSKDHKPVAETLEIFKALSRQSTMVIANADDRRLDVLGSRVTFGLQGPASFSPDRVLSTSPDISFTKGNAVYKLPLPGDHNLSNLVASLCVCEQFACDKQALVAAVARYKGVQRRFAVTTLPRGITIIDDYAHNPEKIRAVLRTARGFGARVLAIFQPHGFGPTRFLKDDLVAMFAEELTGSDMLFLLPIYYAGGTAQKDVSSGEIAALVAAHGKTVLAPSDRVELIALIKQHASANDAVLLMGARDPSLSALAREIAAALS